MSEHADGKIRWTCECGKSGWMTPGDNGKDTSLAGLVWKARSIHRCLNPDIVKLDTRGDVYREWMKNRTYAGGI